MNNFLKFYTENNISPVSQNIQNLQQHANRRNSLYRTLGLTPLLFKDKDVLEVAPGSGHNSIVTATYGMKNYDLIEPNLTGFKAMEDLFKEYDLANSSIRFHNTLLEDFQSDSLYDIVICEGLIPGLSNPDNFLQHLADRVRPGGILVLTCADAVSALFETMRRYLARILVFKYNESANISILLPATAVEILTEAFSSHLNSLKGMSRSVEDWIWDNLLNPATGSLASSNEFSIKRCLDLYGQSFYFYGSSPAIMQNYTWYKNSPQDPVEYNKPFEESLLSQQLNFLHYLETSQPDINVSKQIYALGRAFSLQVEKRNPLNPGKFSREDIIRDIEPIIEIQKILSKCELKYSLAAISEFIDVFEDGKVLDAKSISSMAHFATAFGRGQQYISIVKK